MPREEMVILVRCFDFLTWLLPATNNFPRAHRHTLTQRLLDAAFDVQQYLEEANYRRGAERLERLHRAGESLRCVRVYIRLAAKWQWLSATTTRTTTTTTTASGWWWGRPTLFLCRAIPSGYGPGRDSPAAREGFRDEARKTAAPVPGRVLRRCSRPGE